MISTFNYPYKSNGTSVCIGAAREPGSLEFVLPEEVFFLVDFPSTIERRTGTCKQEEQGGVENFVDVDPYC